MGSHVVVPDFEHVALWVSPSVIARVIIALAQQAQADGNAIQAGSGALAAGTATVESVTLSPTSVVAVFRSNPAGALAPGGLVAPPASRSIANGSFVVQAVDLTGKLVNTETSAFEYIILG